MQVLSRPASSSITPRVKQPLKVVAMGDSLVYGYGDPEGGGWAERLRRQWMMEESGGPVLYNLGVRGDGIKQVSQRLEQEFCHRGELRNRVPDAIILSVGVNDSARLGHPQGRQYTEFHQFQRELENVLDRSVQLAPVLFVGMVPVDESKMPFLDCLYYSHVEQYHYKEATKLACQQRQIPYLDLFELWRSRGSSWYRSHLMADGLHPNVEGYRSLYQDIRHWEALQGLKTQSMTQSSATA